MDLDNIILPAFQIAELYKGSLVDVPNSLFKETAVSMLQTKQENTVAATAAIKYIGGNYKNVLVIVDQPKQENVEEKDLAFLTTVLKACNFALSDIAIVNIANQRVTYNQLKEQLYPRQILLFNVEPVAIMLPFMVPSFQVQKYDGIALLMAPPLAVMNEPSNEGKLLKTKLWMCLKQVFGIS